MYPLKNWDLSIEHGDVSIEHRDLSIEFPDFSQGLIHDQRIAGLQWKVAKFSNQTEREQQLTTTITYKVI